MIKRVNNDQPYCGVNVKGSEGTCLALDFHGTMVIFVKRLIILFYRRLSDQVSTITNYMTKIFPTMKNYQESLLLNLKRDLMGKWRCMLMENHSEMN